MTELLPCPFCGGEARIRKYCDTCLEEIDFKCAHDTSPDAICQSGEQVFWIEHDCKGIDEENWGVLSTGCHVSAREAIEAWNTRSAGTCENVDTDDDCYFECSVCGSATLVEYKSGGYGVPNYCPNCGRKVSA